MERYKNISEPQIRFFPNSSENRITPPAHTISVNPFNISHVIQENIRISKTEAVQKK